MACEFDSGFSSAFAICVGSPQNLTPDTVVGTFVALPPSITIATRMMGVPGRVRRRPEVQPVVGILLVRPLGYAAATGEAALNGRGLVPVAGTGTGMREGARGGVLVLDTAAEGSGVGIALTGAAMGVHQAADGLLVGECGLRGEIPMRTRHRGQLRLERAISGRLPIRQGAEAAGVLVENDEQTTLMVLGLPSELG